MVVGSVVGAVAGQRVAILQPIGDLFIRVLVLAAVPLVFFNLLAGLTTLTDLRVLGRLTAKLATYFLATKVVALLLGMAAMELFKPGVGMTLRVAVDQPVAAPPSATQVLMDLVPTNVVRAFAEGNVAQVVVLAVLLGVATLLLDEGPRDRFRSAFDDIARLLRQVVDIILIAAPFGIGALMALTVGRYGAQLFGPVARFVAGVTTAHLVMIAVYLTLLKLFAGRSPLAEATVGSRWRFSSRRVRYGPPRWRPPRAWRRSRWPSKRRRSWACRARSTRSRFRSAFKSTRMGPRSCSCRS